MHRNIDSRVKRNVHSAIVQLHFKNKHTYVEEIRFVVTRGGEANWMKAVKRCKLPFIRKRSTGGIE